MNTKFLSGFTHVAQNPKTFFTTEAQRHKDESNKSLLVKANLRFLLATGFCQAFSVSLWLNLFSSHA